MTLQGNKALLIIANRTTRKFREGKPTGDPKKLPLDVQIRQVRKSLNKSEKRLERFNEIASKNSINELGTEYRRKAALEQEIVSHKRGLIRTLDRKLKSIDERELTKKINIKKAEQASILAMTSEIKRIEKSGIAEEERKKRRFLEAQAKLDGFKGEGNIEKVNLDTSLKKRFTEQPRRERNTSNTVTIVTTKNGKQRKRNIKINK